MQRPVATDELEEHAGRNGGKRVAVKTHTLAERSLPGIGRGATLSGLDRAGRSKSGFSGGHSATDFGRIWRLGLLPRLPGTRA